MVGVKRCDACERPRAEIGEVFAVTIHRFAGAVTSRVFLCTRCTLSGTALVKAASKAEPLLFASILLK